MGRQLSGPFDSGNAIVAGVTTSLSAQQGQRHEEYAEAGVKATVLERSFKGT